MKYTVSIAVDGRLDIEVEADSFSDAKAKALVKFGYVDLEKMDVVNYDAVNAESETGEFEDF